MLSNAEKRLPLRQTGIEERLMCDECLETLQAGEKAKIRVDLLVRRRSHTNAQISSEFTPHTKSEEQIRDMDLVEKVARTIQTILE